MLSLKRVRTHGPRLLTTGVGSTCSTSSVAGGPKRRSIGNKVAKVFINRSGRSRLNNAVLLQKICEKFKNKRRLVGAGGCRLHLAASQEVCLEGGEILKRGASRARREQRARGSGGRRTFHVSHFGLRLERFSEQVGNERCLGHNRRLLHCWAESSRTSRGSEEGTDMGTHIHSTAPHPAGTHRRSTEEIIHGARAHSRRKIRGRRLIRSNQILRQHPFARRSGGPRGLESTAKVPKIIVTSHVRGPSEIRKPVVVVWPVRASARERRALR